MFWALAFSHHSQVLATSCGDGKILIWDVIARKILHTIIGHHDRVFALAFSPNHHLLPTIG
jgi:WD40 repeat protein